MGFAYSNLGKYQNAVECYEKALEIDPKHLNALFNMGIANVNLGNKNKALENFEAVKKIDSKNIEVKEYLLKLRKELKGK